jgi:monofunctional biosynthetic peptidoglycan transglycosylase
VLKKKRNQKKTKKRSRGARIFRFVMKVLFYGFLLSVVYILFCKWINPPVTITQLSSAISGNGIQRKYVDYKNISNDMKLAVMAGEDQLFAMHDGFDYKSIRKAMKHNEQGKRRRGASTISQQVAKNVFLWQHGGFFRKGLEVYFTFMIEHLWSKRRILELYVYVADTGDGIFGVEAAAQKYFNKSAKNLSAKEAAMIAASLPNPKKFTIKPLSKRVANRYPWIMRQMNSLRGNVEVRAILE